MDVKLNFEGIDYQPLKEIKLVNVNCKNTSLEQSIKNDLELKTGIIRSFLDKANKDESNILIGRGKENKSKKISMLTFFPNDISQTYDGINSDARINGVVGALSGRLVHDDLKSFCREELLDGLEDIVLWINLQIKSRLDDEKHSYFVATLLTYGVVDTNLEQVYDKEDSLYDFLLIDILANRLMEAIPKGYYKRYHRFDNNDDRLKGSIDIARNIRLNLGQVNGRIAYSYRENTINNTFNAFILKTYHYIKNKYPDLVEHKIENNGDLYDFIKGIEYSFTDRSYKLRELILENIKPIGHPYFQEYEEVRKVCLKILRDEGVSIFDSDQGAVSGFLYYLPDLWEEFLENIMQSCLKEERKIQISSQNEIGFLQNNDGTKYSSKSRPDFIFKLEDTQDVLLVLDAKMKPGWEKVINPGVNNRSLMELFSSDIDKCMRDMVTFNSIGTGIIFPMKRDVLSGRINTRFERKISKYNDEKRFSVLPFEVPNHDENLSYDQWKKHFDESIDNFKNNLMNEVISPYIHRYEKKTVLSKDLGSFIRELIANNKVSIDDLKAIMENVKK